MRRQGSRERHAMQKKVLDVTDVRIKGMKAIDPRLDLGGGVSVAALAKMEAELRAAIDRSDKIEMERVATEVQMQNLTKAVRDLNERALASAKGRFGADSEQYKQVGGTRKSEKRRSVRAPRNTPQPIPVISAAPKAGWQVAAPLVAAASATNGVSASEKNGHAV